MKMNEEKASNAELRDPDFWHDYHANVQTQIEKINSLLSDLRSASEPNKNAEPFPDEIQLATAVGQRVEHLQEAFNSRRLTIENQIDPTLPVMRVDRPKFDRLVDLLLKDELAMLPSGSKINLTATRVENDILLQLRDNGPALPPGALQVILDPFTVSTSGPSEYGINLMACFFIVHHHGGKIEAQSQPTGNLFTIHLPIKPERVNSPTNEDADFLKRSLLNDNLWKKLLGNT